MGEDSEIVGASKNERSESSMSTELAQIYLLAIPLLSAPVAFYLNSTQASTYSLGLEFLIIGVIVLEFIILVVLKSEISLDMGIFSDEEVEERFETKLVCESCNNTLRKSLTMDSPRKIECAQCGQYGMFRINANQDGIVQTETPLP